jgi:hypothetical protein
MKELNCKMYIPTSIILYPKLLLVVVLSFLHKCNIFSTVLRCEPSPVVYRISMFIFDYAKMF